MDQHGVATRSEPSFGQPDLAEILKVIRRDVETWLLPELSSSHARTIAAQIDTTLRYLIVREAQPGSAASVPPPIDDREMAQRVRADLASKPPLSPIGDAACLDAINAETRLAQSVLDAENGVSSGESEAIASSALGADWLAAYLAQHLLGRQGLKVTRLEKILGGFSKETYFVDICSQAGEENLALRRDNPFGAVNSSVVNEFALLSALHRKGIAVARPLLAEPDPAVSGQPFMITEKMSGASLQATAGITVNASHVAAAKGLAEVMASFHRLDPRELDLPRSVFDPELSVADHLRRYIGHYEATWRKTRMRPSPTLTAAFEWLRCNIPTAAITPRLVHGDAGLHNLLMHENRPSAMLDWELFHFGDPTEDLVYCRLWIDSVMPWNEFLDHYYRHGGPQYAEERAAYYATQAKLLHCTFGIKAMRGFMDAAMPELNLLYPKLKMTRIFQQLLAAEIAKR